ncbi:serine/threonine protein kinase [Corallococcus sp. H22C18031201]|nr:serine/threonine protein kinase [Corallococcus sp. H22C18031201]
MSPPQPTVPIPENSGASDTPLLRPYGQYVLVRKLAEGGMAEIFLAKLLGTDGFERNVVIKRMLPHLSNIPDFVEMFRDEARLAAKLSHPNIIQIHELGFTDGCYYICMEYLAGEDFSTTLRLAGRRRQYVPLPVVLRVLIDAAHGLHHAHEFTNEQGQPLHVVHRDISPSNLYLTYQGQVKVLDFGIAKAESRLVHTRTGVVKGKYMYMAPEQAQGLEVDRRADIFALGVSLYEAVTHVRPFARDNDLAVLNALTRGEFEAPRTLRADLPEVLEAIILKAMAGQRDDRYATAEEFAQDLEIFLAEHLRATGASTTLAAFLRSHFGEERFTERTRIPTLATLNVSAAVEGVAQPAAPVVAPPPVSSAPAPVRTGAGDGATVQGRPWVPPVSSESDKAPGTPTRSGPVEMAPAPRRWRSLAVGLVGGLVLAGGAFVVARAWAPGDAQPAAPAVVTAVPVPPAAPTVEPAPAQPPEAAPSPGGDATPSDVTAHPAAGAAPGSVATPEGATPTEPDKVAVPAVGTGTPGQDAVAFAADTRQPAANPNPKGAARPAKLVTLGIDDIQRVVSGGRSRITSCFERFKADLPASQGEVQVQLRIVSSGKVTADTKGPLASTEVGRCLESQAQRLRFPAHRDQEVTVMMPFSWRVTQ